MNGYFVVVPGVLVTSFIYRISSMIDQISKYSFGVKSEILKDVFYQSDNLEIILSNLFFRVACPIHNNTVF